MKYEFEVDHIGQISDGHHSFEELYYHRMVLFATICNLRPEGAWKSLKHDDGSMFENFFIVGQATSDGQFTYHYHMDHWDTFKVKELEFAPKWDGHTSEDVVRLMSLR